MSHQASDIHKAASSCLFSSSSTRTYWLVLIPIALVLTARSQDTSEKPDSIVSLGDVLVKGFGSGLSRNAVPASVSLLREKELVRFSQTSLVPVMNTVPGVRMEERSPGSYRLSIRGSLIRSPFGVRNVKVYLDDLILTDAGGNTYLNLIDLNAISAIEVIRGPAGSLYGSGTGGVVHLTGGNAFTAHVDSTKFPIQLQVSGGSYGQYAQSLRWATAGRYSSFQLTQGVHLSDGYRRNSQMRRDVVQAEWSGRSKTGDTYRAIILMSDLSYRTPGGLTLAQQTADPQQARPATPTLPSAEAQRTGIRNGTLLSGITATHHIGPRVKWRNAFTLSRTQFSNPFFTNYERRKEANLGFRSIIDWHREWSSVGINWISGIEWQRGHYAIDSSGNQGGMPDRRLVRDAVESSQGFLFTQAEIRLPGGIRLQAGISLNQFNYRLERTIGLPSFSNAGLGFKNQPAPRMAAIWNPARTWSVYASVTRGFSPPSLSEVKPSAGGYATGLQAENGWSREAGLKGSLWRNRLQFDATIFDFHLRDAIVRRTNASGAEYFVNAGDTRQKGLEAFMEVFPIQAPMSSSIRQLRLWTSMAISEFRFGDYTSGSVSFRGNRLTGVPDATLTAGIDLFLPHGLYLQLTRYHCGKLPLTDANDVFADAYNLWFARTGWKTKVQNLPVELYLAADNLSDVLYSSGNDLNAFARRFYNPAPRRSLMAGVRLGF